MSQAEPICEMMLTVRDVAELLSVGVRTVWRWTRVGRLPAPLKLGPRTVRWRASEIQAYIDRLTRTSQPIRQELAADSPPLFSGL